MRRAAWVYTALTAVVCCFHLALIAGVPWGHLTMGGRWPGVVPVQARAVSGLSIVVLCAMAAVVLARSGAVRIRLPNWAIWVVVGLQCVAVVAHIMTPSAAERALWLPLILVQLVCAVVVARATQPRRA